MSKSSRRARARHQPRRDLYQEITDRIVTHLESGQLPPWRQPLKADAGGDPFPKNLSTGKAYRGINVWLLSLTAWSQGYGSSYWLTFKQAQGLGAQVRQGEKGSLVTFWTEYTKKDHQTEQETKLPVLKHYTVFNAEQVEGIDPPDQIALDPNATPFLPIARAEAIVQGFAGGPTIEHRGHRACYEPQRDRIVIASPEHFTIPEEYYGTLYHELTHATGHSSRLDRGIDTKLAPFGSEDYTKEELVAEMGAAFLAAVAGISPPTLQNSASYLAGWLRALKSDKKLVVQAAGKAQKSADFILGVKFEQAAVETPPPEKLPAASEPRPNKQQTFGF